MKPSKRAGRITSCRKQESRQHASTPSCGRKTQHSGTWCKNSREARSKKRWRSSMCKAASTKFSTATSGWPPIAHEYVKQPEGTLVVSPDNRSRTEINQAIHYAMQDAGKMPYREHEMMVLVARQEITGADRQWAAQYEGGDVVRYTRGTKTHGIAAGEYARVERVDEKENLVTVKRKKEE